MSLIAAAICPSPPMLVPEVAAGAAGDLDDLRAACDAAVAALLAAEPQAIVVVGVGPRTASIEPPRRPSFRGFGLREPGGEPVDGRLPLGPSIGVWLLQRAGHRPHRVQSVAGDAAAEECARVGAGLVNGGRLALLVVGDGSACRDDGTPGFTDPRAAAFDAAAAHALGTADVPALLAVDEALATRVRAQGRAAWQVLAGAARQPAAGIQAELTYDAAPFGVGYFVAVWRCA